MISNENFICDINLANNWTDQIVLSCEKIKKFFPNAKIILVIRNQTDIIESFYREELTIGTQLSFKEYFEYLKSNYLFDTFKYYSVIQMYFECFGKKNVKVILFDDLIKKYVLQKFEDFLNCSFNTSKISFVKKNKSLSYNSLLITKFLSKFMSKTGVLYKYKKTFLYTTIKSIRKFDYILGDYKNPKKFCRLS